MLIMKLLVLFVLISFFLNFNFSHAVLKKLLTTKTIKDLVEKNNKVKEAGDTAGHYKSDGSLDFYSREKGDVTYIYKSDGNLRTYVKLINEKFCSYPKP